LIEHWSVVALDHAVVEHPMPSPPSIRAEGVYMYEPKLRPEMVTDISPEVTPFTLNSDVTVGASYENVFIFVPTTAATVIAANTGLVGLLTGGFVVHRTWVPVVHEVVAQFSTFSAPLPAEGAKTTVGVTAPAVLKLIPSKVSVWPPERAVLTCLKLLSTGASNDMPCNLVPTTAVTNTVCRTMVSAEPTSDLSVARHRTAESETHCVETHEV
jgi:hypothetical protein